MLMRLRQHRVVQTFLTCGFESLLVAESILRESRWTALW